MQVIVKEVSNPNEFKEFYTYQNKLYSGVSEYVPTLDIDQKNTLKNDPALEYCTRKLWLAYKGDKIVGRIQAIVNPRYNEYYDLKRVRFGWFDFEDDVEVAKALLDTASAWGKEQGMNEIHGPLAYNTLGRQGMLIEGFENTPPTTCLYNFPYYPQFMENLGYDKECDWIQYKLNAQQGVPEKLQRISAMLLKRYNLRLLNINKLNKKQKKELVNKFFELYNVCFRDVHNFIPFTQQEIDNTGKFYFKLIKMKPQLTCLVLDEDDEIAAFGLCIPSLSESFKKAKGKLFPLGWLHILYNFFNPSNVDLMLVGSSPKWASKGLSAIYHSNLADSFVSNKLIYAITNPQIDTNTAAVKVWESYDNELYMRRRCWIKSI